MELREAIKILREKTQWRQEDVANYLGVDPSTISKIGSGWEAHWQAFLKLLPLLVQYDLLSDELPEADRRILRQFAQGLMSDDKSKSLDVLGIKPLADTVQTLTTATVEAAGAFLGRICLPAAEEFGLLLRDKVSNWRAKNAIAVVQKAEAKLAKQKDSSNLHAHPRLVFAAIEKGSWADGEALQEMWAGLLASSCTPDGNDESNLIFTTLLGQITASQAKVFSHCCEQTTKTKSGGGWISAEVMFMELDELKTLTGITDIHRIDRELDHLRALDILHAGFAPHSTTARLEPTGLGLQMYVRCQGYLGSPTKYFGLD
jgi:DNA-binding XRE family transcriptional regulator